MASTAQQPIASQNAHAEIRVEYLKSYLEYLDKEQTIQGVLCSFCVVGAATVIAKVLLTKAIDGDLLSRLQGDAFPFVLGTVVAFSIAAFYFYEQRSALVALHGSITLAVATFAEQESKVRRDSKSLQESLLFADSYELWNPYQWGLAFLYLAAVQAIAALIAAQFKFPSNVWTWIVEGIVFGGAAIAAYVVCNGRRKLDDGPDSRAVRHRRKRKV